ncbi:hypothetical protein [Algihabitans albus]|uniref:hypothetical protein n=1 Tax=Algihabitans albus TaxID=2164067 RepID=UPI000E5CB86A|nr:hypothetical protein [Algihabitans albus]
MAQLWYGDDPASEYVVELFDRVEVRLGDGMVAEGLVKKIHPRRREVSVRYEDHIDAYRTTSNPRRKTVRVPVTAVDLIARDG